MNDALTRATFSVSTDSLQWAVLDVSSLPPEFRRFDLFRQGVLDNHAMAEQGFPGNTAETFRGQGRITGYIKEFLAPSTVASVKPGTDVAIATVIHLFDGRDSVSTWMKDVFLRQFEENVGRKVGKDQELQSARRLQVSGFHDEALGLKALQDGPNGLFTSTVVDFRIGRLLGVAFLVTAGDVDRLSLALQVAHEFERQTVRVVLGAA